MYQLAQVLKVGAKSLLDISLNNLFYVQKIRKGPG